MSCVQDTCASYRSRGLTRSVRARFRAYLQLPMREVWVRYAIETGFSTPAIHGDLQISHAGCGATVNGGPFFRARSFRTIIRSIPPAGADSRLRSLRYEALANHGVDRSPLRINLAAFGIRTPNARTYATGWDCSRRRSRAPPSGSTVAFNSNPAFRLSYDRLLVPYMSP